ncbi:MAG: hypothetical protein NZM06_05800 [Chloroherpetonaceae bacterium]|nr:hypothetical protein [Chloroherpetonaceae bacterium]MDW8436848.1 hypothetical protein [Chloroherpetonaceae bacterium]
MNAQLSPRWARLVKTEEIETPKYYIDCYVCPVDFDELRERHIDEPPVLYAFAVFTRENKYLLSYALEMRKAIRVKDDETEEEYVGYFLETYCEHQRFSCKNFRETLPDFETVRSMVIQLIVEYDAVEKMLEYDREMANQRAENS